MSNNREDGIYSVYQDDDGGYYCIKSDCDPNEDIDKITFDLYPEENEKYSGLFSTFPDNDFEITFNHDEEILSIKPCPIVLSPGSPSSITEKPQEQETDTELSPFNTHSVDYKLRRFIKARISGVTADGLGETLAPILEGSMEATAMQTRAATHAPGTPEKNPVER